MPLLMGQLISYEVLKISQARKLANVPVDNSIKFLLQFQYALSVYCFEFYTWKLLFELF